jgi:outer membrane protein assembly factor BamC
MSELEPMKVNSIKITTLLVMMATSLTGCGAFNALDEVVPDNTQKYRKASTMPPLDVPPDLSTSRINDDIAGTQDPTATYSEFEEASTNPLAEKYNVIADKKPALSGEGANRHLVVPGEREVTWARIQDFWSSKGLEVTRIDERIGIMDTSADADGYAYRIRMDRGDTSLMSEVFLNGVDETKSNNQKNEATLRQLADYLGTLYKEDVAEFRIPAPAAPEEESARVLILDDTDGQQSMLIEQDFRTAWLRVGRVLDSKGFKVEDRDQSLGYYLVHYLDPFKEIQPDEDGILDKLAFWRDEVEENPEEYYYIKLTSEAADTRVIILDAEQVRTSNDTAKRLLNLIQEQLAP